MPPRSKKTGAAEGSSQSRPALSTKPAPVAPRKQDPVTELFNAFANKSSGKIEAEGIMTLCSCLGVSHTDVRMLMLAWKMQAETQGYFTITEWREGLTDLKADTLPKLKASLVGLANEVNTPPNFESFYSYAFTYCLTEERQRTVDIETVCTLLELVLPNYPAQVETIVEYLKAQVDYKVISLDQWKGFYRFITEISFPDFGNFRSEDAWPCILDDLVDWVRAKQQG